MAVDVKNALEQRANSQGQPAVNDAKRNSITELIRIMELEIERALSSDETIKKKLSEDVTEVAGDWVDVTE